jgi:hypothetical protein
VPRTDADAATADADAAVGLSSPMTGELPRTLEPRRLPHVLPP